ncbi:hypothetical protein QN277_011211 [Acacia crassicarpa]|uniref:Protein kinase domain-containing protein n=1 Tax=Acacia crassicarpa TaxID=499986 RepID=A0AAE1TCE7_9FABA|nr:hypothetical protein QN277_011211 [Acacia crassicarpa]
MGMGILIKCFGCSSSSSSIKQPSTTVEYLCRRFSLAELRKLTGDFDRSRIIGEGPYGVAYRASISVNGQIEDVAVKRLRQPEAYGISLYKNDILFTCQLHHPNLLSLVGFCDDNTEMIVVHEYAPNGSLFDQLYKLPRLSWKRRLEISTGVARGLHYLHSGTKRTIIHGNIAPVTVMLDENWVPKLSFFGLSKKAPKSQAKDVKRKELESVEGSVGSRKCLRVPNDVMHKSDVYSFGELLVELICQNTPFNNTIDERLVAEMTEECWKLYREITESCLSEDPNERPDMGDVEVQLERLLQLQEEADTNHVLLI